MGDLLYCVDSDLRDQTIEAKNESYRRVMIVFILFSIIYVIIFYYYYRCSAREEGINIRNKGVSFKTVLKGLKLIQGCGKGNKCLEEFWKIYLQRKSPQ